MPLMDFRPFNRQFSTVNRKWILIILFSLPLVSCGRYKARKELEQTQVFAEIVKREDLRWIGEDKFFENNLLANPSPEVSEWCAIALGRIADPKALPLLYRALHSTDTAVRAASAFAIGEIEDRDQRGELYLTLDPRAASELQGLLDDLSISVRMRAVEALGKIGSGQDAAGIVRRLERFSYQETPYERAYLGISITALARLDNLVAVPVLERFAGSDDPEIQWRALDALARLQSKPSTPLFVKNLQNPNSEVRACAACGMAYVADAGQADLLFPLLAPRQDKRGEANPLPVRICALLSLGFMKNPAAIAAIQTAISAEAVDENHPDQQNFAIQAAFALGNIGAKNSETVLLSLLRLSGPVADRAAGSLAFILKEDPKHFFELAESYHSVGKVSDVAWAKAIAELRGPEAVKVLNQMLQHAMEARDARVREILPDILYALAKTGTPVSQETWNLLLQGRDCAVLPAAVEINKLLLPGAKAPWVPAVEAFSACNSSSNIQARLEILSDLKPWIQEKEVQQLLWTGLKDSAIQVRIASHTLLRGACVPGIPESPDPGRGAITDAVSQALAATRKNSTIAQIETTRGMMEIELFREDAPVSVQSFVLMAKRGVYDGMELARPIPFQIQGSLPQARLILGRAINVETNMRPFERGSFGMALAGQNSDAGGFFIALSPQPNLDGVRTCFGRVVSGIQVADRVVPGDRILKIRIKETVSFQDYQRY